MTLATDILTRAYALVPQELDHVAQTLHGVAWAELVEGLEFQPWDTGGGCMMLMASTPWGTSVGLTNGDAELPEDVDNYWVGVMGPDDTVELYAVQVQHGEVVWQGGELS